MKHVYLIDLDVLLDTRIGALATIDEEEAVNILNSGFTSRQTDDLSDVDTSITNVEFKEAYANRDTETLKHSRLTSYIFELADNIAQFTLNILNDDSRIDEPCIVLNYYPYSDLDATDIENIIYAITQHVTDAIDIKADYYEPAKLDLPFLKENSFLTYVCYDLDAWLTSTLTISKGRANIVPYPKLNVIAPMLMPNKDSFNKLDGHVHEVLKNKTPFEFMQTYWSPLFGLKYCPVELMSIMDTSIVPS